MLSNQFWLCNSQLHSFLWGMDQWIALQVGSPLQCSQVRCTFDELDATLVADRTLCVRRGANHSMVRLFHQETALGVIDVRFETQPSTTACSEELTLAAPPPFAGVDDAFAQTFPHVATRLIHPQPADVHRIARAIAEQSGALSQLEIASAAWSDHQNADLRISATQLHAAIWRVASNQRGAA